MDAEQGGGDVYLWLVWRDICFAKAPFQLQTFLLHCIGVVFVRLTEAASQVDRGHEDMHLEQQ